MTDSFKINYNGQIGKAQDLEVPYNNRSFKFGDGLFESIRIIDGQIPFLSLHIQRLVAGAEILGIQIPKLNWENQIAKLLLINDVNQGGKLRISLFRSGLGTYFPQGNEASFLIEVEEVPESGYLLNQNGVELGIYSEILKSINKLSVIKTNNSLLYVMAANWAQKEGYDDAIILNQKGNICESSNSNIFFVKNDVIYTPSLSQGCVAGIMRKVVIEHANKLGIEVKEAGIKKEFFSVADECFLSNAIQGIRWIGGFNEKRFFNKTAFSLHRSITESIKKVRV